MLFLRKKAFSMLVACVVFLFVAISVVPSFNEQTDGHGKVPAEVEQTLRKTRHGDSDDGEKPKENAAEPIGEVSSIKYACRIEEPAKLYQKKKEDPQPHCCSAVLNDFDKGLTLQHTISRYVCGTIEPTFKSNKRLLRLLQIGANAGDNSNDHVVRMVAAGHLDAVLVEPVPWLFKRLQNTYKNVVAEPNREDFNEDAHRTHNGKTVRLIRAAISEQDAESVTFDAPKEGTRGWANQVGGFNASKNRSNRKHLKAQILQPITVKVYGVNTLLQKAWGWKCTSNNSVSNLGGMDCLPDVVVIDTEGHDAVIMTALLQKMSVVNKDGTKPFLIPIVQFEWKHLSKDMRRSIEEQLQSLGYCVMQVHYDTLAYLSGQSPAEGLGWPSKCENSFSFAMLRP